MTKQLFNEIKNIIALDDITPNCYDDTVRQEYQHMMWEKNPFVSDERLKKMLNLVDNDKRVRIFDSEIIRENDEMVGELQLVHFLPNKNTSLPSEGVEDVRGFVYYVPNDRYKPVKMVARSFPHTPEYILLPSHEKEVSEKIEEFEPQSAVHAHEGCILRLFNFENKWRFSTHKKIDGLRSRWTGDSFGKILERVLPDLDTSVLNENYCYVLLLEDPHTGLVCSGIHGEVYHVSTYDMSEEPILVKPLNTIGCLAENVDLDNLLSTVKDIDPTKECGILLKNKKGDYMKILNDSYYAAREFLDNEPSLAIRYLELRALNQHHLLRELLPRGEEKYNLIEDSLPNMAEYLGHLWYFRDFKNNYLQIDKKCFETLRSVEFFERISAYTKRNERASLIHIKSLVIVATRKISNAKYINNIIKLMKNDYEKYHDSQKEWSDLFK